MDDNEFAQSAERGRQVLERARNYCETNRVHYWDSHTDGSAFSITAKEALGLLDYFEEMRQDAARRQKQACVAQIQPCEIVTDDEDEFSMRSRLTREAFADWIAETELVK